MEHYYALPGHFEATGTTAAGKPDFFKASGRNDFHICPDTHGTLLWESGVMDGWPFSEADSSTAAFSLPV